MRNAVIVMIWVVHCKWWMLVGGNGFVFVVVCDMGATSTHVNGVVGPPWCDTSKPFDVGRVWL